MASSTTSTAADQQSSALVRQNLRLVVLIGRQFANRGVDTPDLIQEGSIGLIKASRRFDQTRGVRFSTYAAWWIRQGMGRAVAEQGRTVRLPSHVRGELRQVAQTAHELVGKLGRPAATNEIAARMQSTPDRVQRLLDLRVVPLSLDAPASRALLAMRFGIDGEPCTLQEAAGRLGLNANLARQIEQRALKRLRHNPALASFVDGIR